MKRWLQAAWLFVLMPSLIGVAVGLVGISTLHGAEIWATKDYSPKTIRKAVTIVAGLVDKGTDPTNGELNAGITELEEGTKTAMKWEWTSVPADICTAGAQCATVGQTICELKGWELGGSSKPGGVLCLFDCVDSEEVSQLTLGIVCP